MDLLSAGLAVQLLGAVALGALLLLGPPPPRKTLRAREDGRTEVVDDDGDADTWRVLVRLAVAVLVSGALLDVVGLTRA